ncbi:MAG: glycine dehydrogenase, partial [Microthrixaceae bacterium]
MTERQPATTFADRHLGPRPEDVEAMLAVLGVATVEALIEQAVPKTIRTDQPLALPDARSEPEVLALLRTLADRNEVVTSLIGTGYSGTHTPGVILRNVLENPAWYTAYTPYQPEISQGRLEALLTFQTMVTDLTGMDIAGASMLDESTAAAEAMTLIRRSTKHASARFFVDAETHPQTIAVVATRAEPIGIEIVVGSLDELDPSVVFGALLQHPGTSGVVRDLSPTIAAVHAAGGLVAVATDLLACTILTPPGEQGADVVVGSSQRFGVPMGYGGPHAGFLATRDSLRRSMPGRLVGVSVDTAGRPAHRLALQTREQHLRPENATTNICTA